MAFISIVGESQCRYEELARIVSQRLGFELVTELHLRESLVAEFGALDLFRDLDPLREKAWPHLARSVLAKRGVEQHLVIATTRTGLLDDLPNHFRAFIFGPGDRLGLKRAAQNLDLILNGGNWTVEQMADLVECAVKVRGLREAGLLAQTVAAEVQFQTRLTLARYGLQLPERAAVERSQFGHPSEEVFANLLNFYRISWEHEPRSFPLQWDKDGRVLEAFTPDFYLPEFDLYIELTTMKQAHVTRKNRKVRLLRAIYPHVNIQVFYQKDVQDLVMKHGLPERLAR